MQCWSLDAGSQMLQMPIFSGLAERAAQQVVAVAGDVSQPLLGMQVRPWQCLMA